VQDGAGASTGRGAPVAERLQALAGNDREVLRKGNISVLELSVVGGVIVQLEIEIIEQRIVHPKSGPDGGFAIAERIPH